MSIISRFLLGYFLISVVLTTILILTMVNLDKLIEKGKINWALSLYLVEIKFAFHKTKPIKNIFMLLALLLILPIILVFVIFKMIKDFIKRFIKQKN